MKLLLSLTVVASAAVLLSAADESGVVYVGHDKVAAALAKGGPLASGPNHIVSGSPREKGGSVEIHEKETDVFYVTDGQATLVTGGTIVGGKTTKPGQIIGTDIKGGQAHQLTKGDVVVVPAGTPHWFKAVPNSVSYFVVKVVKP